MGTRVRGIESNSASAPNSYAFNAVLEELLQSSLIRPRLSCCLFINL